MGNLEKREWMMFCWSPAVQARFSTKIGFRGPTSFSEGRFVDYLRGTLRVMVINTHRRRRLAFHISGSFTHNDR